MLDMIVLTDMHWGIGQNGDLLTRIPEDMRFFKKITMNKPVIMGRKTRDSLPKGYLDYYKWYFDPEKKDCYL